MPLRILQGGIVRRWLSWLFDLSRLYGWGLGRTQGFRCRRRRLRQLSAPDLGLAVSFGELLICNCAFLFGLGDENRSFCADFPI